MFQATQPLRQVFADERNALIGGLPSEEDSEFFETAPAGAAALDFDAMERDASAASVPTPDAGAALEGLWQLRQTLNMHSAFFGTRSYILQHQCS